MVDGDIYSAIDSCLTQTIAGRGGFNELAQTSPVILAPELYDRRTTRLAVIQQFFQTTLNIFRQAVAGEVSPFLLRLLFNDAPFTCRERFHQQLPEAAWSIPRFFRTDESKNGEILELQCPGSGWGDLDLLCGVYRRVMTSPALSKYNAAMSVAEEIVSLCGTASPSVLHLLDNSSNPTSMRFLLAATQPPLRYWGYDRSVRNGECEFVRSHSFFGLVAENLFRHRLQMASEGKTRFDLPPILVFDQKAPLCLPFLDETRGLYSEEIRQSLAYSYPVTSDGFRDVDGAWVSIEEFLARPPSGRCYFLKYAGCDVGLNWGSRAVYRLTERDAPERLRRAADDSDRDAFWLIQPEIAEKDMVTYVDRDGRVRHEKLTVKYSCFYGPTRLIGVRTMHRRHFKVHGQADTVIGIAVPGFGNIEVQP